MTKLFDDRNAPSARSGVPADNQEDQPESFLAALVGEDKKFRDHEALAKAKWESDTKYIPRLESENEQLRQELQKRLTAEELVQQLRSANQPPRDPEDLDPNPVNNTPDIKNEVLAEVKKLLEREQSKTQAQRNVEIVSNELRSVWGPNFQGKLATRAKELDLEPDYLATLAEQKPQTFLKLVLPPKQMSTDYAPPQSSRNVPSNVSGERNNAYYQKMKKENPKQYWTKANLAQEHRDAVRLGDKFFD